MNLHRIFGFALVAAAGTGVTLSVLHFRPPVDGHRSAAQTIAVPAMIRSLRPTYPYSIIPGGAYNRDELRTQLRRNPVARDHYADFEVEKTQLIASERDQFAYVSYRQYGQVFWTKNKLRIPKGELLLTDGRHLARTRCGNRLSNQKPAAAETSPTEPIADLMMPTTSGPKITDQRITFSAPPPSETQVAQASLTNLPWEPKELPFEWKPSTQLLSASPTSPSLSNIMAAPFLFPPATRTTTTTGAPVPGTPSGTTAPQGGTTPIGSPTLPIAPIAPVPEPNYTVLFGIALALLAWNSRMVACSRTRRTVRSRSKDS